MGPVLIAGVFVGLVYGLLALGLIVIYRASRIVNFAYGETGMFATFVYLEVRLGITKQAYSAKGTDRGIVLALVAALLVGVVIGMATELLVARPARKSSPLNGTVGTIAASVLLLTAAIDRYGVNNHVAKPLVDGAGFRLFGIEISPAQLLTGAVAVIIIAGLGLLYRYSSLGLRLRATAVDPYAASLCGINVNATSAATWGLGGGLAALSAILIAGMRPGINVLFMTLLFARAFAAALVGGLTSMWGGLLFGLLFGIVEGLIQYETSISGITELCLAVGILVLMVARPRGLVQAQY
jgi:branched-chain amino acid transport system permease protein